jgi:hypothetical protein
VAVAKNLTTESRANPDPKAEEFVNPKSRAG